MSGHSEKSPLLPASEETFSRASDRPLRRRPQEEVIRGSCFGRKRNCFALVGSTVATATSRRGGHYPWKLLRKGLFCARLIDRCDGDSRGGGFRGIDRRDGGLKRRRKLSVGAASEGTVLRSSDRPLRRRPPEEEEIIRGSCLSRFLLLASRSPDEASPFLRDDVVSRFSRRCPSPLLLTSFSPTCPLTFSPTCLRQISPLSFRHPANNLTFQPLPPALLPCLTNPCVTNPCNRSPRRRTPARAQKAFRPIIPVSRTMP